MNNRLIKNLSNQAIENVSNKRKLSDGQIERTWLQDDFEQEFARLLIEEVYTIVDELIYKYKDGGETLDFMAGHYSATLEFRVKLKQLFGVEIREYI